MKTYLRRVGKRERRVCVWSRVYAFVRVRVYVFMCVFKPADAPNFPFVKYFPFIFVLGRSQIAPPRISSGLGPLPQPLRLPSPSPMPPSPTFSVPKSLLSPPIPSTPSPLHTL